jgi:hypothetical protein
MVTTEDMDHQLGDTNNLLMVAQEDLLWALNQATTWGDGSMVNMVVVRLLHILGVDTLPHLHREACIHKEVDHRWRPIVLAMVRGMREVHLRRYRLQVVAVVENQWRDHLRKLQTVRRAVLLMDRHLLVATKGDGDNIPVKQVSGDLSISGEAHPRRIVADLRCINRHMAAAAQACTVAALILHNGVESVTQEHLQKWWEAIPEDKWELFANQLTAPKLICTLVDAGPVVTMTMIMVRWREETVPKTRDEGATNVEG